MPAAESAIAITVAACRNSFGARCSGRRSMRASTWPRLISSSSTPNQPGSRPAIPCCNRSRSSDTGARVPGGRRCPSCRPRTRVLSMATDTARPGALPDFVQGPHRMLIGGEWVEASSGKTFATHRPVQRRGAAAGPLRRRRRRRPGRQGGAPGVRRRALDAQDDGRRARAGSSTGSPTSSSQNAEELAQIEALDNGKPLTFAQFVDVALRRGPLRATTPAGRPRSRARRSRSRCPTCSSTRARSRSASCGADHPLELPAPDGGVEARARRWRAAARSCSSPPSRRRSRRCGWAS